MTASALVAATDALAAMIRGAHHAVTRLLRAKPVTLLAVAHAILGIGLAFGVIGWTGTQLAAVEGLFAALGWKASTQVTANARLDDATLASVQRQPWAGPLTAGPPDGPGDA